MSKKPRQIRGTKKPTKAKRREQIDWSKRDRELNTKGFVRKLLDEKSRKLKGLGLISAVDYALHEYLLKNSRFSEETIAGLKENFRKIRLITAVMVKTREGKTVPISSAKEIAEDILNRDIGIKIPTPQKELLETLGKAPQHAKVLFPTDFRSIFDRYHRTLDNQAKTIAKKDNVEKQHLLVFNLGRLPKSW